MATVVKVKKAALVQLLNEPGVAAKVTAAAERVAIGVQGSASEIHGHPLRVKTDSNKNRQRPPRPRSAIIVTHPTPKGRRYGQQALVAVTSTIFGGDMRRAR